MSTDTARLAETAARAALGSYFNEDRGRTQSLGLSVTAAIAAAIRAARQAALDEAARLVETQQEAHHSSADHDDYYLGPRRHNNLAGLAYAAGIRSLMAPKGETAVCNETTADREVGDAG